MAGGMRGVGGNDRELERQEPEQDFECLTCERQKRKQSEVLDTQSDPGRGDLLDGGSHSYHVLSQPFPPGTTWDQANNLMQRYNAPTADALHGLGGNPASTSGWVTDPATGYVPIGRVTFDRGDGWVTNTTQFPHPFEGTITRQLVYDGDQNIRVLTTGEGQGGLLGPIRHEINAQSGPSIFQDLDNHMMTEAGLEYGR
jgi:hypothetical protein